jgi:hypothetical protein
MEITIEKSQEQAEILQMIGICVATLDLEYLEQAAKDTLMQANRQESMAVLNPSYPQVKNDILRTQGQALSCLCQYIGKLKEIDALKLKMKDEDVMRQQIQSLFI